MTVWYVRRDYMFRDRDHCVGETLPTKVTEVDFNFSSYLVIALFHRRGIITASYELFTFVFLLMS